MKLQDLKAEDTIVLQNDKEAKKLRKLLEKEGYTHFETGKRLNLKKARSSNCINIDRHSKSFGYYSLSSDGCEFSVFDFIKPKFKVICESEEQVEAVKNFMKKSKDTNPPIKEEIDFSKAGQILVDISMNPTRYVLSSGENTAYLFSGTELSTGFFCIAWAKDDFQIFKGKLEIEN